MIDPNKLFLLRSTLTNQSGNNVDRCSFERVFNIRYLHDTGRNATIYNKELDMHFYNESAITSVYEIETVDFFVDASNRLDKAKELIRKMNYKYDWIQIGINREGRVVSIANKDELKMRWERLKEAIRKDYKGDVVEHALSQMDKQFAGDTIMDVTLQYFHFGLLFPQIPPRHQAGWTANRTIEFSEYENERFEESIEFKEEKEQVRLYDIRWNTAPDAQFTINKSTGSMSVGNDDIFPQDIKIEFEFEKDKIVNQWSFELLRYNQ